MGTLPTGTGPGVITRDGCAVDLYALLEPRGEAQVVHAAVPPGAPVLELGAGAGRIADALAALGHPVTAVDDSPQMLARVRAAQPVCARIEDLDLGERFPVVLLASHLVNAGDEAAREAFLAARARHVAPGGSVILQQHPPSWFAAAAPCSREAGGLSFTMRDVTRPGPGLVSATIEYRAGDRVWTQTFTARRLDDAGLRAALAAAGLALAGYLTDDHQWARATPLHRQARH